MTDLQRLIYFSRNNIVGDEATITAEVGQILESARRKNPPIGITGALMFNGTCFAQVLEGPPEAVGTVLETIQHDKRHHDVTVLDRRSVENRVFPHWSMAFVGEKTSKANIFSIIGEKSGFNLAHIEVDDMLVSLHQLVCEAELEIRSVRSRRIWALGSQGWPAGSSATGTGRWSLQKKSFRKLRRP